MIDCTTYVGNTKTELTAFVGNEKSCVGGVTRAARCTTDPLLLAGRVLEALQHLDHLVGRDRRMRRMVVDALEVGVRLVFDLLRELLAHRRPHARDVARRRRCKRGR